MSINFLPQDYQAPRTAGAYMKLCEGENRFRILTAPAIGWEDWLDKKPVRYRYDAKPAKSIDPAKPIKHFWAFIVWNCIEERIQILQITQATIRNTLETLCKDTDWGAPYFYDIKIIKTGEGKNTEYAVTPLPHKPVSESVKKAFYETPCNLDALFTGDDPFSPGSAQTPGVFDSDELDIGGASERGPELYEMLLKCSPEFQKHIGEFLTKNKLQPDMSDLPEHLCDRLEKAILKDLAAEMVIGE